MSSPTTSSTRKGLSAPVSLSPAQERRLLDYAEDQFMSLMRDFKKRSVCYLLLLGSIHSNHRVVQIRTTDTVDDTPGILGRITYPVLLHHADPPGGPVY
jgi:hypothetical protein